MESSSYAAATKGKRKRTGKGKGKGKAEAKAHVTDTKQKKRSGPSCELCHESLFDEDGPYAIFNNVPLTVSCLSCAEGFRSYEGMLLACQTRAMKEFKLSVDDLAVLQYTTKPNPHSSRSPLKLFVRAECEVGVEAQHSSSALVSLAFSGSGVARCCQLPGELVVARVPRKRV